MLAGEDLGQRQVEAALGARAGAHRDAEARASRGAAVDGDEKGTLPARTVVALDVGALEEDTVLDRDRVQVARTDAEERKRPSGAGSSVNSVVPSSLRRACQSRMRAGRSQRFHECGPTA